MLAARRSFAKSALAEGLRGQRRVCGSLRAKASAEHLALAEMFNSRTAMVFHGCGLTPELRRTALRNGGVLHASTQAEPRSGLGLNELLGRIARCKTAYELAWDDAEQFKEPAPSPPDEALVLPPHVPHCRNYHHDQEDESQYGDQKSYQR